MKTKILSDWLTLAANFGVIAGILFLALEIRQSNRIALVTNEVSIRQTYAESNRATFTNKESAELIARAQDSGAKFDATELEMLSAYVFSQLNLWAAIEIAYDNDMLPYETFDDSQDDMRAFIKYYPAMRSLFRNTMVDYPSGKDSEVYRVIHEAIKEANQ